MAALDTQRKALLCGSRRSKAENKYWSPTLRGTVRRLPAKVSTERRSEQFSQGKKTTTEIPCSIKI